MMQQKLQYLDAETQWQRAEAYNEKLRNGQAVTEEYWEILEIYDGAMGHLEIPGIDVTLPIYHGVSESVLKKGVGHLPQTALPIGGAGNHTVLTGHTGLPSAKLLTDLTELKTGDRFYIWILGQCLTYQIDQIHVVLPTEAENLEPVPDRDHCTLVTCTPYGINSHRLLVRGYRIE